MRHRRRPAPERLPRDAVAIDAVVHDDGVWQLARGRLTLTGEPVGVRRPCQPSPRAAALLAAELQLLAIVGGDSLPNVIGLVDDGAGAAALVWRPAVVGSLADLRLTAVPPPTRRALAGDAAPSEGGDPRGTEVTDPATEGPRALDAAQVAGIVGRLADALTTLHGAGFAHAGVEPAAVAFDVDGWAVLASVGSARRSGSGRARPTDDVAALGRLGLDLLSTSGTGRSTRGDADDEAVRAVLGRLVDPDPGRRPDARTAAEVLRRAGPTPRPVPILDPITPATPTPTPATPATATPTPTPASPASPAAPTPTGATPIRPATAIRPIGSRAAAPGTIARPTPGAPTDPDGPARRPDPSADTPSARDLGHVPPAIASPGPPGPAAPATPDAAARSGRSGSVPGRHRSSVLAALGAALLVAGIARLQADGPPGGDRPTAACPVAGAPAEAPGTVTVQADVDGRGCTVAVRWQPERGEVEIVAPEGVRRYGLGQAGDELVVADWDCDGTATPMLRRPVEGRAWRFDAWPTDQRPVEPTPVPVDRSPPTC